jgi:lysophospholipase L1-like esterase
VASIEDQNSTVWGDITQGEWTALEPANAPTIQANAGTTTDGYLDAVIVNPSAGTGLYYLESYFTPPPNVTAMSFEVDHLENGSSCSFNASITVSGGGSNVSTATCTTGSGWATCTTGSTAVTAGTAYRARLTIPSNSCTAYIGKVRTRVLTTTNPLFTSAYTRYNASSGLLWDNAHNDLVFNGSLPFPYRYQSALSRFVFDTNASVLGVNILNQLGGLTISPDWDTLVSVNGRPWALLTGAFGVPDVQNVTLPSPPPGATTVTVEVTTSVSVYVAPTFPANYHPYGQYSGQATTLGVIVPQGSVFNIRPPPTTQSRIVILGDSKDVGLYAGNATTQGWPAILRQSFPSISILVESVSGLSLYATSQTTAIQQTGIAALAQTQPTAVLFALGRNDWYGTGEGTQSAADYQTMAGAWLDDFHAASPMTTIWAMSTTLESVLQEAATNSFGSLLSAYRTAMSAACSARSTWCNFIDGTTVTGWSQTTSLADGIHPNAIGSYQIATWLGPILIPQPQNSGYWAAPNWAPPSGGGGGFSVTGTGFPWFNSGSPLSAAQQLSSNVTLGTPSAGFVPATVTGAQGNAIQFSTNGTVTWAGTDSAAGFIQNTTTNATTEPMQFIPQGSLNANGNGSLVQFLTYAPSGSGSEGGFEQSTVGWSNNFLAPIDSGHDALTLHVTSRNSTNYSVKGDGANLFLNATSSAGDVFIQAAGQTIGAFETTSGIGGMWVLPGGVSPIANNAAIASDGATLTYFNGEGGLALSVGGATAGNIGEYLTPSGVLLNGHVSNFGDGTGVLVLAEATAAPTLPDGIAGNSILFSEPSGLYADEPNPGAWGQLQWQLAPTVGGTKNTQNGTFAIAAAFATSTSSSAPAIITLPIPSGLCLNTEVMITGRTNSGTLGGVQCYGHNVFCNSGGAITWDSVQPTCAGDLAGSASANYSGTNAIYTVGNTGTPTWDWTGVAQHVIYN